MITSQANVEAFDLKFDTKLARIVGFDDPIHPPPTPTP